MTVLVLSCPEDITADLVIDRLSTMGVPVLRFDPADFPGRVGLSTSYTKGTITGSITHGRRTVDVADVRSIWIRRPGRPGGGATVQRGWTAHECDHALYGALRAQPGIRWMNHPDAQRAARYKAGQLCTAHAVGLSTPDLVITTVPADAEAFATRSGPVVCKSISGRHPDDPPAALPTTLVPPGADFSAVAHAPTCLQRRVAKVADIRLTVVGDRLFCARSDTGHRVLDWRFEEGVEWRNVPVPESIGPKVRAFMAASGLAYGALDFVVDEAEGWHFLECNPAGQFGFIELTTGQPVALAIAEWLT
ncbi:hypothetical protein AF335_15175 [Streptomyces eurocidicus]|uniref:ATP-grasp ribosomal peptide maturase n=1 Tax=Streptomyces eurocidicus TaxID=66423 RepID=A0A2N8NVR0_STREU|nr:hypothetical protein [Streptomyces eurocidicus]MBB5121355.1 ATP-grasp ribosomal peptide maturase [Streptomyces eurocidicus]MBF6055957.1 hypothetical protein [Streptomyces eurocidicus]PNE32868.1 hypothetical protein AF335_15175 [Streptomyces eurocidicus]